MSEHRYILEPYKGTNTRYHCPGCQRAKKTFSLYIDTETGEHIHPTVGRCNRESNCGHHYTPKQYFRDNNISFDALQPKAYEAESCYTSNKNPFHSFRLRCLKPSLKGTRTNHFVKYLIDLFGVEIASELVSRYFIATSKYWKAQRVLANRYAGQSKNGQNNALRSHHGQKSKRTVQSY